MFRKRRKYLIRKKGVGIAVSEGHSARDAIDRFASRQTPQRIPSGGWGAKDFLKYSLQAERVKTRPPQMSLWQVCLGFAAIGAAYASLSGHAFAMFGVIFLSPILLHLMRKP